MEFKDIITITDKLGFIYRVVIKHSPQFGFSTAFYEDDIIAQAEYGRMYPPTSDNDKEWEEFEEHFLEWSGAAITDLELMCKEYFNKKL